jgi:ribokinase
MGHIAVLGSVAWDEVVALRQPLTPGGHLGAVRLGMRMGGGAVNTGMPLAHAAHDVVIVSAVGGDASGDRLLEELTAAGVSVAGVRRVEGPSTHSLVLVDPDGEQTVINLHRCIDPALPDRLAGMSADAVYVRSRAAGLAPWLEEQCERALVVAHLPPVEAGERPAHGLVGSATDLDAEALAAPWRLGQRVAGRPLRWMVVTHGASGASVYTQDGYVHVPAPRVVPRDTTGAGDALAAGLMHALLAGTPLPEAVRIAVAWGAEAAASEGSVLSCDAVHRLMGRGDEP